MILTYDIMLYIRLLYPHYQKMEKLSIYIRRLNHINFIILNKYMFVTFRIHIKQMQWEGTLANIINITINNYIALTNQLF